MSSEPPTAARRRRRPARRRHDHRGEAAGRRTHPDAPRAGGRAAELAAEWVAAIDAPPGAARASAPPAAGCRAAACAPPPRRRPPPKPDRRRRVGWRRRRRPATYRSPTEATAAALAPTALREQFPSKDDRNSGGAEEAAPRALAALLSPWPREISFVMYVRLVRAAAFEDASDGAEDDENGGGGVEPSSASAAAPLLHSCSATCGRLSASPPPLTPWRCFGRPPTPLPTLLATSGTTGCCGCWTIA